MPESKWEQKLAKFYTKEQNLSILFTFPSPPVGIVPKIAKRKLDAWKKV